MTTYDSQHETDGDLDPTQSLGDRTGKGADDPTLGAGERAGVGTEDPTLGEGERAGVGQTPEADPEREDPYRGNSEVGAGESEIWRKDEREPDPTRGAGERA